MIRSRIAAAILFSFSMVPALAQAQNQAQSGPNDNLKIIDNPGGGQIVYGPLSDQSTMKGAMIAMLRSIHGHFGEKPVIGDFFEAKGSNSVATFFTTHAKKQGGGATAVSGMVIVSMAQGSTPIGAVLYDDSARFARTQPVLMNALNDAWRTASVKNASAQQTAPVRQTDLPPLRQATAGDRSASIGLPPGWALTWVAGGALTAAGPNGEMMALGLMYQQIHDPRMRNQRLPYGGGNAHPLVASYSGGLFNAFVSVTNQARQNGGKPQGTYKLISSRNLPGQAIEAIYEVDLHDGKGPRKGSARIGALVTRGLPTWAMTVSASNAPETVFEAQNPVMMAMLRTYSQDAQVIGRENKAVLDRIRAVGAASARQAAAADARRIASSNAFNSHMDDISRNSKSFQNYILDRSQLAAVGSNGVTYHGTVSNNTAAALVAANPNQFQIVPSQNFVKGPDF